MNDIAINCKTGETMDPENEWKVALLVKCLDCDRETAIEFLESEEWDPDDAISAYRIEEEEKLERHWRHMRNPSYRRHQMLLERLGRQE